jgi:hypothetical protein
MHVSYNKAMVDLPFDPSALGRKDMIGARLGGFAEVGHIKETILVVKTFPPDNGRQKSERRIYEHVLAQNQQHPNVLRYCGRVPAQYDIFRGGLVLGVSSSRDSSR